jgi:hypothetical protein
MDADILDIDDKDPHDTIIESKESFKIRFRVQLQGRLWKCICGPLVLRCRLLGHRRRAGLQPVRRPAPSDDLSSIPGLEDKHLRALARQQITDVRGLADADRRAIYRAMANLRPRPTLDRISRWQDDARSMLDEAVTDASDWHTAASFAVVFAQRRVGDAWERRVEAERTEVEPERESGAWVGWEDASQ